MPQKRLFGSAAVLTSGVPAGIIESSSGSASVTPMPRRNVRRGRCFFVMKDMIRSPYRCSNAPAALSSGMLHSEHCIVNCITYDFTFI